MVGFHKPLSPYWLPGFWKLGFYPIPQVGDWKILFRGNWPKRKDQKIWIFGVSSNGRSGPHHAIGWPMAGRPCPWHTDHSVRGYVPHSGKPSTVIALQLGLSLSPNKQLHCYRGIFANIILAFLDLLITKAFVLISLKILASPFTKLAFLPLCVSIAPLPPSLPKLRLVFFFLSFWHRLKLLSTLWGLTELTPYVCCSIAHWLFLLCWCFCVYLHFMSFSPTLLFECSEPDPGFLGINNKCFKAFCALARYHYLEICWHLI